MRIVGIVIEANPFHNGHQYLIDKCKNELNPDLLIAVCSGYFTMRGEISVLSKYDKTKILLDSGFDIVIDLPTSCYLNSSKKFAENSIFLLNKAGITDLVFGVEDFTKEDLDKIIKLESQTNFHEVYLKNTKVHFSNKISYAKTIEELSNDLSLANKTLLPNNTLALDYIKAINKINQNISIHPIKRIGSNDNTIEITNFPSGTALRNAICNNEPIDKFIPYSKNLLINLNNAYNNLNILYKQLHLIKNTNYKDIMLISEGIENYILKNLNLESSFEENINTLANKKYTKSRIRRTLLSMFLKLPKTINENIPLRVLGFSKKGENYLSKLDDIIVNINQSNSFYIEQEIMMAKLYSIISNKDITLTEYKFPRKDK